MADEPSMRRTYCEPFAKTQGVAVGHVVALDSGALPLVGGQIGEGRGRGAAAESRLNPFARTRAGVVAAVSQIEIELEATGRLARQQFQRSANVVGRLGAERAGALRHAGSLVAIRSAVRGRFMIAPFVSTGPTRRCARCWLLLVTDCGQVGENSATER